jgi:type VI secretion system secreted protein Hcp
VIWATSTIGCPLIQVAVAARAATFLTMAETVHLSLKSNGNNIEGESSQHDLDRDKTIECLIFRDSVRTARELGSRAAVGRRVHEPIEITKRIDASSPLLAKALCRNEKIEGTFRFYRPSPSGDGTTEQFFTVEITDGRVDSIERHSPSALDPAVSKAPPLETIRFVYHSIRWVYEPSGAEYVDSWSASDA